MAEHVFKLKAELDTTQAQSQLQKLESSPTPEIASAAKGISKSLGGLENTLKNGSSSLDKAFDALKRLAGSIGIGKSVGIGSAFGPAGTIAGATLGVGIGLAAALNAWQKSIDEEKAKMQESLNKLSEEFEEAATQIEQSSRFFDRVAQSRQIAERVSAFSDSRSVEAEIKRQQEAQTKLDETWTGYGSIRSRLMALRSQQEDKLASAANDEERERIRTHYSKLEEELNQQYNDAVEQHNAIQAHIDALKSQANLLKKQEAEIERANLERSNFEQEQFELMQKTVAEGIAKQAEAASSRHDEETKAYYQMLKGVQLAELYSERSGLQTLMSGIQSGPVNTTSLAKVGMYMGEQDAQSRYVDQRMDMLRSIVDKLIDIDHRMQRITDKGITTSTILG